MIYMSNLGMYQWMTATAKKMGGPVQFLTAVAAAGAVTYKASEIIVKKCKKALDAKRLFRAKNVKSNENLYSVNSPGESNEKVSFDIGDQFKVLEEDGDSVLIEKIGEENNPYFVSSELIEEISDYKESKGK